MNGIRRFTNGIVLGALVLAALGPAAGPAGAAPDPAPPPAAASEPAASATINVTTFADEWNDPSQPASASTKCSLREALQLLYLNGNRGCGPLKVAAAFVTIQMPPGTYMLTYNDFLPFIGTYQTITIAGPNVVIDGYGAVNMGEPGRGDGIFKIVNGVLNLKDVTLQNGLLAGGGAAIHMVGGTLIADKVLFENNQSVQTPGEAINGGAILNETGDLTVTNSIFKDNVASGGGGAVSAHFGYFFKDKFLNNIAGRGGAFFDPTPSTYPVIIEESEFKDNTATHLFNAPDNSYASNTDIYGGGAIANYGNLQVYRSLIQGNHTELSKGGGGVDNHGTMLMSECVLTGNDAKAAGSGGSNPHVSTTFGGAIINYGTLDLVRCSIYGNQADYAGGILNHGANGLLSLYNSTVTNNTANTAYPSLVNDLASFGNSSNGATLRLVHTTVGKNNSGLGGSIGNALYAEYNHSIYFANSILDAACLTNQAGPQQYSQGGSISSNTCPTFPDPAVSPTPDLVVQNSALLGLGPLTKGNATVAQFMVQPLLANSTAAGIGDDNQWTCNDPHILRRDANLAPRANPACDAGAIQVGSVPPQFTSTPSQGVVAFPVVDLANATRSYTNLTINNNGGGALHYQIVLNDVASNANIVFFNAGLSGTLYHGQQFVMPMQCVPPAVGDYWVGYVIKTNAPNAPVANYQFKCTGTNSNANNGQASMSSPPGPYNMSKPQLGQPANSSLSVSNPGTQPLTANAAWSTPGGMWGVTGQAAGQGPDSPAANIPPGQSAQFNISCTPQSFGTFVNTLVITTNDPNNPVIHYDVACEAVVNSPPEDLALQTALPTGIAMEGVAVSPDGQEVLAGGITDNHLRYFARATDTGALTPFSYIASPGMSGIFGVVFSHDNQNVYYTAQNGNGLITARGVGVALTINNVITSGTTYLCGILQFCPIGAGLVGPRGVAISPDDQYVYVAGFFSGTLAVFQRNTTTGALSYAQTFTRTINGVPVLGGATRVATSPDGQFVYVAAQTDNAVVVFQRNAVTGLLSYQTAYKNGLGGLSTLVQPNDLALSPDGNFLYVTASGSNVINIFSRSSADGGLTLSTTLPVANPWGVAVSPDNDGRRVYLANYGSNSVHVYGRNPVSGALSFVHAFTQTTTGPAFIAPSLDDQDIYVTQYDGQALQQFSTIENGPVLTHISPASALVNSGPVTLTVVGGRFYPDSQIVWNGAPQPTTFDDEHTLEAVIPGGLINVASTPPVLVHNPRALNTGNSSSLPFTITPPAAPPVPSISSTNPPEAEFGGSDLLVFVYGANFAQDAVVYYNHQALPTTFISSQTLQVGLSADILAAPGEGGLEVVNGGGAPAATSLPDGPAAPEAPDTSHSSTVASFKVNPPGAAGLPALTSLSPASVLTVSAAAPITGTVFAWITLHGHNFSSDPAAPSVGRWNGQARNSLVVDANTLLMELTDADRAAPNTAQITVLTPGAGESGPLSFRVRGLNEKPIPVLASAILNGFTLTLNGSDFVNGAQVHVNGAPRATTFVNSFQVKITVTASEHGVVLTVVNPGPGGGSSNALNAYLARLFLPIVTR